MPSTFSLPTSTSISTTSVKVAFTEVKFGSSPFTVVSRWWPPTRASMSTLSRGTDKLAGPNHRASWAEPVNAR
jgi:hypothetical protein